MMAQATRRSILVGTVASAAAVIPAAGPTGRYADAELIRLCGEFDALEHQYRAAGRGAHTPEQEARAAVALEDIVDRQAPLLDRICTMPCTTAAGRAALAASLMLWDAEIDIEEDDPGANTNDRLIAALLRATLGRAS